MCHLLALPTRQPQTPESRAGSDNGGLGELSQLPEEYALQRSFAAFSWRPISPRASFPNPLKVYLSVATSHHHFPYGSFATIPGFSTLVDQPTIMLRSVSHPSAKTRITCGTTKRM